MRYAILIYDENTADPSLPPPDPAEWAKVTEAVRRLQPDADRERRVRRRRRPSGHHRHHHPVQGRQTVMTDGPFAETKEGLSGVLHRRGTRSRPRARAGQGLPGPWYGSIEVRRCGTGLPGGPDRERGRHPPRDRGGLRRRWRPPRHPARLSTACSATITDGRSQPHRAARRLRPRGGEPPGHLPRGARKWPVNGLPRNPEAWTAVTARNRAIDRLRRAKRLPTSRRLVGTRRDRCRRGPGPRQRRSTRMRSR